MDAMTPFKPHCKLLGTDGNVFALLVRVRAALVKAKQPDQATEMARRVMVSGSYHEALAIMGEYVEIR